MVNGFRQGQRVSGIYDGLPFAGQVAYQHRGIVVVILDTPITFAGIQKHLLRIDPKLDTVTRS